jgi:hypothetical protein
MRKNSLARQARRAYSQTELQRVCTLREDRFGRAFGMQTVKVAQQASRWSPSDRPEDYYHFRDNGSSVLAVAHLDTVVSQQGRTPHFSSTERGPLIVSGALDDRLGAYVILHLLPKLGVTCDWLLTVGEESGASTADFFDGQGKKYDWAIEFDRGGTDVVMYQFEDDASVRLVEAAGAEVGFGSFSDIAYLEQLGVKAFNWGVGYRGNYHSESGYAYLDDTFAMVAKYLRFHEQNAGTAMPHEPRKPSGKRSRSYDWDRWDNEYYAACDVCFTTESVDSVTGYCLYCGACSDCGQAEDAGCMCYVPRHVRDEAAGSDRSERDWREMTWGEYCELRPDRADVDDVLCATCSRHVYRCECPYEDDPDGQPVKLPQDATCADCGKDIVDACTCALDDAYQQAQAKDGPGALVSHGLGVPTARNKRSPSIAPPWNREIGSGAARAASLSEDIVAAVTAARGTGRRKSSVNPKAVTAASWHEAAESGLDGMYVIGHQPAQDWAKMCLRCAARWPHPIADTREIHQETDCPGCDRCTGAIMASGAIHVIPAHLAGDSDLCPSCLSDLDRGDSLPRPALRALDS